MYEMETERFDARAPSNCPTCPLECVDCAFVPHITDGGCRRTYLAGVMIIASVVIQLI